MTSTAIAVYVLVCVLAFASQVESVCPEGFCRHSGGCYLPVALQVSWVDATHYCKILNGELAVPDSLAKQRAMEGAIRRSAGLDKPGKFWLYITDLLNPGDWRTMKTRQALSYTNWAHPSSLDAFENETLPLVLSTSENKTSSSPGSSQTEEKRRNCVYMSEEADYRWMASSCEGKMNFVCYSAGLQKRVRNYYGDRMIDVEAHEVDFVEKIC